MEGLERICRLPAEFPRSGKSAHQLVHEAGVEPANIEPKAVALVLQAEAEKGDGSLLVLAEPRDERDHARSRQRRAAGGRGLADRLRPPGPRWPVESQPLRSARLGRHFRGPPPARAAGRQGAAASSRAPTEATALGAGSRPGTGHRRRRPPGSGIGNEKGISPITEQGNWTYPHPVLMHPRTRESFGKPPDGDRWTYPFPRTTAWRSRNQLVGVTCRGLTQMNADVLLLIRVHRRNLRPPVGSAPPRIIRLNQPLFPPPAAPCGRPGGRWPGRA